MTGRQPRHAKQPRSSHRAPQTAWRMYGATFHACHHPTAPSAPELEAGGPCWPALLSCPQLGPIGPHPITDRSDTPAARPVPHADSKRTWGEIVCWKCRQGVWACVMAWGGQGSVATRPSALQKQNPERCSMARHHTPTSDAARPGGYIGPIRRAKAKGLRVWGRATGGGSSRALPSRHTETTEKDGGGRRRVWPFCMPLGGPTATTTRT